MLLRRAAIELLQGRRLGAATVGGVVPAPSAAAAAAAQQSRSFAESRPEEESMQQQTQPFSVAMKQLEAAVTTKLLPADALAANAKSLAMLKEFAANLSNCSEAGFPPNMVKNVQFVFRDPYSEGRLQRVRCLLKTTGGDCAPRVQQTLGQLLHRLGLPPHFYFDGDQFKPKPRPRPRPQIVPTPRSAAAAPAAPPTPQHVEAVRAQAAAAGFPSQTVTEKQFRELEQQSAAARQEKQKLSEEEQAALDKISKIEPLLGAVAAVPWLAKAADRESWDKAQMIRTRVVDEIEAWGWDVRGPIQQIWEGERQLAQLQLKGKDAASQLAIKTILYHAAQNDKKYGKRRYPD